MISDEPEYFKLVPDSDFSISDPMRNELFQNKYKRESLRIYDSLRKLTTRRDLPPSKKVNLMNKLLNNFQNNLEKTVGSASSENNTFKKITLPEPPTNIPTSEKANSTVKKSFGIISTKKSKSPIERLKKAQKRANIAKKRKLEEFSDTFSESSDPDTSFSTPSYSPVKIKTAVPSYTPAAAKKYLPGKYADPEQKLIKDFKTKLSFADSPDNETVGSLEYPGYQKVATSYKKDARDLLHHAIENGLDYNRRTRDGYGNFKIDTYLQNLINTKITDASSEAVESTKQFIKDFQIPGSLIKNSFYRKHISQLGSGSGLSNLVSYNGQKTKPKKIKWLDFNK